MRTHERINARCAADAAPLFSNSAVAHSSPSSSLPPHDQTTPLPNQTGHDERAFDAADADAARLRLAAFESAWARSDDALRAVQRRLVEPVFEQIRAHALETRRPAAAAATTAAAAATATATATAEVPVVLLSIGASADHAHTCPDLAHFLRERRHPVALANGRDLANGSAAPLLHAALRQFLGAATPADDVAALVAWWADEVKERGGARAAAAAAAAEDDDGADGDDAAAAADGAAKDAGAAADDQARRLRSGRAGTRSGGPRPLRPPVLVVSDAERCDMPALQQLVKELSEVG